MQTVVAPWLDKPKEDLEVKKFKGDSVSFTCAAQGFPLQVEWKFQKRGEDIVQSCFSECGQSFVEQLLYKSSTSNHNKRLHFQMAGAYM